MTEAGLRSDKLRLICATNDTLMTQSPSQSNSSFDDIELLSAYLDNQLSVAERVNLERRLRAEPSLRAELEELRATATLLNSLPPAPPPRSFTLDPAKVQPRRGWFAPGAGWLRLGGVLATLLVALSATMLLIVGGGGETPAQIAIAPTAPGLLPESGPMTAREAFTQPPAATAAPAAGAPLVEATVVVEEATEAPAAGILADPGVTAAGENGAEAGGAHSLEDPTAAADLQANPPPVGTSDSTAPQTQQVDPPAPAPAPQPRALLILGGVGLALAGIALALWLIWRQRRRI